MNETETNAQRIMTELLAAKKENSELCDKNSELRAALHDLVEACHRADNDGDLSSEIDGSLMSAAWEALK